MFFKDWIQVVIESVTFLTVLFGIVKVFNRHESEWREKEIRLQEAERDISEIKGYLFKLASIEAVMTDMRGEMERMRNRLDKFLDRQGE